MNDLNITLLTCPNLIQNIPLCHSNDKGKFPAPQDTEITDNPTAPLPQVEKNANVNQRSKSTNPVSQVRPPWEYFTAFRLVLWDHWPFGAANVDHGKKLVDAGHILNVKEVDKPGSLPVVTGICIPQTNIRDSPYRIYMELDVNRKVSKLECLCPDGVICKHGYGLIHYMNTSRDESKTDVSCRFTEPSKAAKKMYPRGEEIEVIDNIPEKHRMPKLSFDMISNEMKDKIAKEMSEAGNTLSPLYTLAVEKLPNDSEDDLDNDEVLFPDWIEKEVFKETDENEIGFRVITYFISLSQIFILYLLRPSMALFSCFCIFERFLESSL